MFTDTRSIFLHGHADGGTGADAKHCRADVAGHFILRLACCGRGRCSDGNGNGKGKGKEASEEEREEDMGKARDRREWFVRAEKELFGARLQWHLHRTADGGGKGDGITTGGDGEGKDVSYVFSMHRSPGQPGRHRLFGDLVQQVSSARPGDLSGCCPAVRAALVVCCVNNGSTVFESFRITVTFPNLTILIMSIVVIDLCRHIVHTFGYSFMRCSHKGESSDGVRSGSDTVERHCTALRGGWPHGKHCV